MPDAPLPPPETDAVSDWAERCLSEISSLAGSETALREQRSSVRYPASGAALIKPAFGNPIPCTLVDRSEGGARLKVVTVFGVPDEFLLLVDDVRMRARVAWRNPSEVGVALAPE